MEQPPRFVTQGECGKVCHQKKSSYGMKQSPRTWFDIFSEVVMKYGMLKCKFDHLVCYKKTKADTL